MVRITRGLKIVLALFVLAAASFSHPMAASAQNYQFTIPTYEVEAYIEQDGSLTLYYIMEFLNDPSASPIDFIDLGLPYATYNLNDIDAKINDQPITQIGDSAYVNGAELALGNLAIAPGESGVVTVWVYNIRGVLFPYDQPDRTDYANFQFTPNSFSPDFEKSDNTHYRMTIILPPGVNGNDGVYYEPAGWPGDATPEAAFTTDNRVYYSWYTENADVHSSYTFGAAFPKSAVPAEAVITQEEYNNQGGSGAGIGSFWNTIQDTLPCCLGGLAIFGLMGYSAYVGQKNAKKRRMQYLPPKISIEGQGIKRGLTAVEAAVLQEEPLDKVLTMILFGLIKKQAISIIERDPLKIQAADPLPENLYDYEKAFVQAFLIDSQSERRKKIQSSLVDLVKTVSEKMKGFSIKETKAYYQDIVKKAWNAVETAKTPEIKSAQFDHTLEWTMLDQDFNEKTTRTFSGGPVIVPMWWPRYDPTFRPAMSAGGGLAGGGAVSAPAAGGSSNSRPSLNLPQIPGSDFAASVVNGASGLAAGVVGDLTGFTGGVTNRTNPIPVSTPRSGSGGFRGGGGGHSCACACACAGCACACAGGGR